MAQLMKPRSEVQVGNSAWPQNIRSGMPVFGAIENALSNAVFCQYFRRFGIPTFLGAIGHVSSKSIYVQCGYEKAILGILAAVCGANTVNFHGGIFGELTFHPVQAILDDDISGMIGRFLDGVQVNEETMALDLINEVGPIPGFYLGKEHTRTWWRREHFMPKVADRLSLPAGPIFGGHVIISVNCFILPGMLSDSHANSLSAIVNSGNINTRAGG